METAAAQFAESKREDLLRGVRPRSTYYYGYGIALAETGRLEEAAPLLRRALALEPKSDWAERARELLQ